MANNPDTRKVRCRITTSDAAGAIELGWRGNGGVGAMGSGAVFTCVMAIGVLFVNNSLLVASDTAVDSKVFSSIKPDEEEALVSSNEEMLGAAVGGAASASGGASGGAGGAGGTAAAPGIAGTAGVGGGVINSHSRMPSVVEIRTNHSRIHANACLLTSYKNAYDQSVRATDG